MPIIRSFAQVRGGCLAWIVGVTLSLGLAAQLPAANPPEELVFFDFTQTFDPGFIITNDARVACVASGAGRALQVITGVKQRWPGITLRPPQGRGDLSAFGQVLIDVRNTGAQKVTVTARLDNAGADGKDHCVSGSQGINPGEAGTVRVDLRRAAGDKLGGKLFGLRGYPVRTGGPGTVDPSRLTQMLMFVAEPKAAHQFEVLRIRAAGRYVAPTASVTDADPYFPLIDAFGQYRHRDWPGKVHSVAELQARRVAEAKELAAQAGPEDWDQYGGWAQGPKLKATGFFRTEKVQGKWWLVDPEGRLFFSHGIDCVRMRDATAVEERENWFADFPGAQPEFKEFLSSNYCLKGHYAGRSPKCFSFAGANLVRKYGPGWRQDYGTVLHQRLRSWGLNTIGNWSDAAVSQMRRTPYVDTIGTGGGRKIEGSDGYWGKFPDVFEPGFAERVRKTMASRQGKSAGDPWCLGIFSDNEMAWGDELSLAVGALKSPADQPAKLALVADLKKRYADIGQLNAAWGATHASWEALLASTNAPDKQKAKDDLAAFYTRAAEQYFRTVREAIKAVAPQQLYLGCRFAWVNDRAAAAAAKYCDVVSYNIYKRGVADFQFNGGADVPLIIGEFHFGALDRGMFHTGLVPVPDQAARAQAYRDYVEGALKHPQFVGCHWFQFQDEPTTGRVYDEENYQIGFVDIADTPYAETIAASRQVGYRLYRAQ